MIGFAMCGSYCTHSRSLVELSKLLGDGYDIIPIVSENVYSTDTRFGKAEELMTKLSSMCGREAIHTVVDAEPLGPSISLDALIICPCTGNTLAKMAAGIVDGYLAELTEDVSWFCKKFDYRYGDEPWYNSKDAVERAMRFLRSDIHRPPEKKSDKK